ncbi:sarcosine oxidase subunit gamma [Planktotalea sp.]|uniref:sarcosine oxidase subunit gamma n=1 Tax=Planktotalea sp. TaxID=2029877 RepID=UPI0025CEC71B|nr:sarcosine oxidase subunit gamma [Planktotalea sp.]
MVDLIATTPAGAMKPYVSGVATLSEIALGKATSIAPFKGQGAAVETALGIKLPKVGKSTSRAGQGVVWFSQGQFLALGFDVPAGVHGLAALTDQSDAWCALDLTGEGAEDVLARLVPVDLRITTFKAGHALRSQLGHMPLHITRLKSGGFRLLSFRSMAGTTVHEIQRAMDHLAGRG